MSTSLESLSQSELTRLASPTLEQVEFMAERLPRHEIEKLIIDLQAMITRPETPKNPKGIFGSQRCVVPDEAETMAYIRSIRDEWKKSTLENLE